MACGATLKRTMDFDPLMNPTSPKRRRCIPVSPSASSSPRKYLRMEPSPFGESSSRLNAGKRDEFSREALITTRGAPNHVIFIFSMIDIAFPFFPFFVFFYPTRTNPPQHQAGVQTHTKEEASRWKLPTVRMLLFSRVPIPVLCSTRLFEFQQ